ncbi:MAG: alkaline phosphatase family protein [Anaerohalosphaera sp.]|nr:alkaline phosphatase family protein [Anaerohalosphaera sp.]
MAENRNIIVGLDGVPFGMIKDFTESGVMPNTSKLLNDSVLTPMYSTVPEISSVAWSSIITGANPAEHGIFGFIDLHPNSYKMRFPNFNDLRAATFWENCEGPSVIVNVPSTYPVRSMNGVHVSGFVSIDYEKSVYPESLVSTLKGLEYRLDVDSMLAHKSMDVFLDDLDRTVDARISSIQTFWDQCKWQNFMFVFTGTDRLMHFLWDAYDDKGHKYHRKFLEYFSKIDAAIGRIIDLSENSDSVILLSDHGFEKLDHDVFVSKILAEEGFLHFNPSEESSLQNIGPKTKAFALDPARIYLNRKDKYPCGSVEEKDANEILNQLEELFSSLEIDGRKVIKHIFKKEDVYEGPYFKDAPDLVLIGDTGFNLKATTAGKSRFGKGIFTGKHTYHDAFLAVKSKNRNISFDKQPSVIDAGKLIRSLTK